MKLKHKKQECKFNLDHVSKEHENKSFNFTLPKHDYMERKRLDRWIYDDYFSTT